MKKSVFFIYLILLSTFFLSLSYSFDNPLKINITESGRIIKTISGTYFIDFSTNVVIENTALENIYDFKIFLNDSSYNIYLENPNYFSNGYISIPIITQNSSVSFNVGIQGRKNEMPNLNRSSLFEKIFNLSIKSNSDIFFSIDKPQESDLELSSELFDKNYSSRLISAKVNNPSSFFQNLDFIDIFKSETLKQGSINILRKEKDLLFFPGQEEVFHVYDNNITGKDVYFLSFDFSIIPDLLIVYNFSYIEEEGVISSPSGGKKIISTPGNETFINETYVDKNDTILQNVTFNNFFLTKEISKDVVFKDDIIDVKLVVYNGNNKSVNVTIKELLPDGFVFVKDDFFYYDDNLGFFNFSLNEFETTELSYKIKYIGENIPKVVVFNGAKLVYDDSLFYSNTVLLYINKIPENKLFVEKKIIFESFDKVKVRLSIVNLGDEVDFFIQDYMDSFYSISPIPIEKGLWHINLKNKENFVIEYYTNSDELIYSLPNVRGVPKENVIYSFLSSFYFSGSAYVDDLGYEKNYFWIVLLLIICLLLLIIFDLFFRQKIHISKVNKNRQNLIHYTDSSQDISLRINELSKLLDENK